MSTKQKTYSNEFKEEAVKRVMSGIPASQVARELDINVNSLYTWKQRYMKHPEQPFVGSGKLHKEDEEKRQLRQRIKELEQENEFLTQTSHMKNMSFSHNHTALSNKHYQAADFCSALRIYSGSLLTKSCAITCSCLSVAWNTVLILASITSCKIIMDCWNVTSAIFFTIR